MPVDSHEKHEIIETPCDEESVTLYLPQPDEPDDIRDWAVTSLYKYVERDQYKQFVKRG
jgi:hypothetical protein